MVARKRFGRTVTVLGCLLALVSAVGCGSAPATPAANGNPSSRATPGKTPAATSTPTALTVLYSSPTGVFTPVFVGVDDGIFEKDGLHVTLKGVSAGAPAVATLTSGEAQIGALGTPEVVNFDAHGGDGVILASLSNVPTLAVYAPAGIRRFADLSGKRIATTGHGTAPYAVLQLLLSRFGMTGKVRIVETHSVPATLSALLGGEADAALLSPPLTTKAMEQGYHEVVNAVQLELPFSYGVIAAVRPYLAGHREQVTRFLRGYVDTWSFMRNPGNEQAVEQAIAHWTHVTPSLAASAYHFIYPVWEASAVPRVDLQSLANLLHASDDPAVKAENPAAMVDETLLNQVLASGSAH
jgi:NitT/TauT family transport system substrate-binding protein